MGGCGGGGHYNLPHVIIKELLICEEEGKYYLFTEHMGVEYQTQHTYTQNYLNLSDIFKAELNLRQKLECRGSFLLTGSFCEISAFLERASLLLE